MRKQQANNRGLTLIELLVTIMIMGIVIAIAVPVLRPPVDARSVKEAARMVSTSLASARTKSIETGRSWGVQFVPVDTDGRVVTTLHFVRPITRTGSNGDVNSSGNFMAPGLSMAEGGTLQLEMVGKKYEVSGDDLIEDSLGLKRFPIPTQPAEGSDYEYRFEHYPRKSSLMPIQLPSRAIVDLGWSGDEAVNSSYPKCNNDCGDNYPLEGMTFTKTGEVDHVYTAAGRQSAGDRIHFFIGKTGRTGTTSDPEDNHLQDGEAIWVSVDPRTGAVKSAENKPPANLETLNTIENARTWANE